MRPNIQNFLFCLLTVTIISCDNNPGKNKHEKIAYVMEQAYKNQEFIGNVLVADSGKVLYTNSFGKADAIKNIKNNDSTKFLIASLSKPITAIIMLKLLDKGLIKLDNQINKFFKIENSKIGKITIHQLLTHSSGINEFVSDKKNYDFNVALNKAVLKFPSGSDFEYSNSGYVLLIKIAELITEKNYEEIVKEQVFEPANMNQSGVARNYDTSMFAMGFKDPSQVETSTVDFPFENVDGAGSLYSTSGDLYKLDIALRNNNLLTEKTKSLMLKQHIPEKYTYGWFISERGGIWDVYWAKGDLPGVTTYVSRRIKKNQLIVLLANAENLDISDIEKDIARILKEPK
jgi:CubicO group peptidase (beta-lactamase class C family)